MTFESAAADTNQAAAPGLNDGNAAVDIRLNAGSGETATSYESGGVIWSSLQTVGEVQFIWGTDQAHVRCGRVNGATCDIENTTIRWKAGVPQIGRDSVVTASGFSGNHHGYANANDLGIAFSESDCH